MKLRVEVMHAFEIEVDDRFDPNETIAPRRGDEPPWTIVDHILSRVTDYTDGRHSFAYEMSLNGATMLAEHVAQCAQSRVAERIAARYPGARMKSYQLRELLGPVRAWPETRLPDDTENPVVTIKPITPRDP